MTTKVLCLLCTLALLAACARTPLPTEAPVRFTLVADTSSGALLQDLVAAYRAERPHVDVRLERAPNAERALEALEGERFDLVSLGWLPEQKKTADVLWYRPFARDAIVLITHPTNPIASLTLLQLRDIFQGQTIGWNQLGGPAHDVFPVSREEGASARSSFEALVMGERNVTPTAVVMHSNQAVVEYVSTTPGAIGYVASAWLDPAVSLLAVEGVTPSPASVKEGRYLLARPFYLASLNEPEDGVAQFVDWVLSRQGQAIVERFYAPAP